VGSLQPTKYLQAKVKYFITKVANEGDAPGTAAAPVQNNVNRLQVDLSIKF
jgi:hypothetical protein